MILYSIISSHIFVEVLRERYEGVDHIFQFCSKNKKSFLHVYGIILGSPVFHLKHSITSIGSPRLPMKRPFHQFPTTRPAFLHSKTLLLVVQSINHSEEKHCGQQLNMIDRLPAKHFTMHPPQRNCEDFPAGGKFCRFPLAASIGPGFPASPELRLPDRDNARWFNARRCKTGSVDSHVN